jgi:hypothetical protein
MASEYAVSGDAAHGIAPDLQGGRVDERHDHRWGTGTFGLPVADPQIEVELRSRIAFAHWAPPAVLT